MKYWQGQKENKEKENEIMNINWEKRQIQYKKNRGRKSIDTERRLDG